MQTAAAGDRSDSGGFLCGAGSDSFQNQILPPACFQTDGIRIFRQNISGKRVAPTSGGGETKLQRTVPFAVNGDPVFCLKNLIAAQRVQMNARTFRKTAQ